MEPDHISTNVALITPPSLTEERKGEMFLPEAEVQSQPAGILGDTSVTLDNTIPKALKEAYNNSFVSLTKPAILNTLSQQQLLVNAEIVKNVAVQMLKDQDRAEQTKAASLVLATIEIFLKKAQQQYQLYLAPGAIHEEQTNQKFPAIANEITENQFSGLQIAFETVKNIAMKALILT